MSRMATTYEFGRRTGVCAATGRPLVPGEHYVAALIEKKPEEGEGLLRADYSEDAWASSPRPEGLFAFWRTTADDSKSDGPKFIDDAALLEMFQQLDGATEPKRVAFRYVLALLLIRKRLLVAAGQRRGVMLVQEKLSGPGSVAAQAKAPTIEVIDPALDAETVEDVTRQLEAVIRVGA